jgi:hypothetical protein
VSSNEPGTEDLAEFVGDRLARYLEVWDSANTKLSEGSYHAADLVDDSFRWVGLLAQDAAAAATLILRAASGAAESRAPGTWEQGSAPR